MMVRSASPVSGEMAENGSGYPAAPTIPRDGYGHQPAILSGNRIWNRRQAGYYPSDYGYSTYQPSPNVTAVYPPPAAGASVTRSYDQYGQEVRSSALPLYLIAFNDRTIRAALSYRVDGNTLTGSVCSSRSPALLGDRNRREAAPV
jgi:hypothetical protein